ncbi:MAG: transcription antitermination factor NusB [Acidobacteriota bacterium]|nr:transcription antitermination factor NusB [Acidobacteriota bacterium]MDW3229122.1 transcription antitermination factor NusB [Acidobacteriota bacterium]MDY0230924.1 transcription antitermination factor NusB [Candidatus Saccharicenans sp.]
MGKRRKAREYALQILFQMEFTRDELSSILPNYWSNQNLPEEIKTYCEWLLQGVCEHRAEVDQVIQQASKNWRLERMATVDRNVLRIAVFEMLYESNLAPPIIIDEAIEIARKFSGQEAAAFINGILDAVYRQLLKSAPEVKTRPAENVGNHEVKK